MKAWEACRPFEELRAADSSADNVSVVKEALAQLGLCRPDVRPPSHRLSDDVRGQIAGILARWGLPPGRAGTPALPGVITAPGPEAHVTPQARILRRCVAPGGSARPACARSATGRGCGRWASTPPGTQGKPVIAIINTWSELNPCHMHLRERAEQVKRGVWQAGGFPVEFGVATLSETLLQADPDDVPQPAGYGDRGDAPLLPDRRRGAHGWLRQDHARRCSWAPRARACPAIYVPAGPMLRGNYRGQAVGSGTDLWKFWDDYRAGLIGDCELADLECGIARSPGHCMTMGTASTMTSAAEALGMTLPGAASIPAVDSAHYRMATASGRRIVEHGLGGPDPGRDPHRGGVRGRGRHRDRAGRLDQRDDPPDRHGRAAAGCRSTSTTSTTSPGGSRSWRTSGRPVTYLMEDFYYAGGLPALLAQLATVPGALHTGPDHGHRPDRWASSSRRPRSGTPT